MKFGQVKTCLNLFDDGSLTYYKEHLFYFRYSYEPFQQSLNDNPEYELPLSAGDYVLIWGNVDDVSTSTYLNDILIQTHEGENI